jgi:immune inhibitor A
MKIRLFALCLAVILAVTLLGGASPKNLPADSAGKSVQSLGMFQATKFDAHYRVPRDENIEQMLVELEVVQPNTARAQVQALVQEFRSEFVKRNPTTPNPGKLRKLREKERQGELGAMAVEAAQSQPQIMSLAVPVEFPNSDTFDWCGESVTTEGPLHNQIPAPGPRDNNTVWYDDATPALYDELYFGVGPKAGVIVNHPNLGKVDLRGNTMANYYLEQSEGKFVPKGAVYPKWLQAAHSEGWYGADNCTGSNHNVLAADLVREVVDAINADDPSFAWQDYDGDGDGVVDNFTVLHAGMGQEAGGGAQGDFSIWSHASAIDFPTGKLACSAGLTGCPDRDIFVREYSMDPENIDVGVISEEFGHAAFGLPDIYTTDYQASPSNWAIMEAGSWNGILGGMQPAPFPLFFRYLVGWADPVEVDYTTGPTSAKVGQLSLRPKRTEQGIKINLPDQVVDIPNLAGTGQAWWSDRGDLADFYLAHDFDLTGTTAPYFSFNSYWSFEEDYDYGYFEVSDDGGTSWTKLQDTSGFFVLDNAGQGVDYGLNGEGSGYLSFDLSTYVGKVITLRLHYTSDVGVQWAGWWADDFLLNDGGAVLFTDDVENPPNGWTTNNFVIVPLTRIYPMYYLAEWRNNSGFDRGLKYAYQTVYSDDDEWQVDRCPYTVPGMLLWLRNAARDFDYVLSDSWYDPPSIGPKHSLLVIDSHYWPMAWSNYTYSSGANVRISSRCQPSNAPFTLQETTPFTIRLGYDPATGEWVDPPLETKTFEPLPGVSQFHDSLGYYPGLWYNLENDGLYFWQAEASAVVPATDNYTTRITWLDKTPAYDLYGADLGVTVLGSGNPGDSGVQYGLHLAVLDQAKDGSWGKIEVWNSQSLLDLTKQVSPAKVKAGQTLTYTLKIVNTTPASQSFELNDPIPEHTTFFKGRFDDRDSKSSYEINDSNPGCSYSSTGQFDYRDSNSAYGKKDPKSKCHPSHNGPYYDPESNSIVWNGTIGPNKTQSFTFQVKVDKDTPKGTIIINQAYLTDGALGDSATAEATVK